MGNGQRGRLISAQDRKQAVELISEAVENGARLYKACEIIKIHTRTFDRWKDSDYIDKRKTCERPEPKNKISKEEEQEILRVCNTEEFSSLAPSQIVPILADRGIYLASETTIYNILKNHKELVHRGRSRAPIKRPMETHKASKACDVWTWDITYLKGPIKGQHYYLYMILDMYSRKIVGWEVWEEESALHASDLIKRAYMDEKIMLNDKPLVLHSDNGSPMKGATMLETLYNLGIVPSRSRPRVSNDNPYSESLFKTLKYRPNYQPRGFNSVNESRLWVRQFVNWYNNEHKHSGLCFISPNERHTGQDKAILEARTKVYQEAKSKHPERWPGAMRNWSIEDEVWLNPVKKEEKKEQDVKAS
ncbi:Integrase core domain protein [Petrocella atlantisensis]|uniref:Integrase core domain protein n=2 Tax=Petrocella atlantisensis TaxID=2173034 RepID=A0A3P7PIG4_9FIRM|nr:Integrase core domain protein [Petrocella atlantisensis]